MSVDRRREPFTILIVPDSARPVFRFSFTRTTIKVVISGLLCFITFMFYQWTSSAWFYQQQVDDLTSELKQTKLHAKAEANNQSETISALEDSLLSLTEEAAQIRAKLGRIEQLERDIQILNDNSSASDNPSKTGKPPLRNEGGTLEQPGNEQLEYATTQLSDQYTDLEDTLADLDERLSNVKLLLEAEHAKQRSIPSIWPLTSRLVTSPFGLRKDPFTRRAAFHNGIDIDGKKGQSVFATADGRVKETGFTKDYGNYVWIDHGHGLETIYMHLSKIETSKGMEISRGDLIGRVGTTGRSTGYHLHYEIHRNEKPVDPTTYLP